MEVHLSPELEARLNQVAKETGYSVDDLVEDAMTGYFEELSQVRATLDGRYDEIKSGRVRPVDGEEFFDGLRRKSQERRAALS
jgi:predicted transcriptional regulator